MAIFFEKLFSNDVLLVALSGWIIAQIIKFITNIFLLRKFDIQRLFGDGGMPSGHSALVSSLATMCAFRCGAESPYFAISLVLALIVMHDALGVRREAGKHAVSIKALADAVNKTFTGEDHKIRTENLKILVGHTPLQVVLGSLLGIGIAVFYNLVIL